MLIFLSSQSLVVHRSDSDAALSTMFSSIILFSVLPHLVQVSALPGDVSSIVAAAASAALAAHSSQPPQPSSGPLVNVTAQTPINGSASIMTSLLSYSGCDDGQKDAINQAYINALNIVGTVGGIWGPAYIFTSNPVGDPDNKINPPWDYFGSPKRTE